MIIQFGMDPAKLHRSHDELGTNVVLLRESTKELMDLNLHIIPHRPILPILSTHLARHVPSLEHVGEFTLRIPHRLLCLQELLFKLLVNLVEHIQRLILSQLKQTAR